MQSGKHLEHVRVGCAVGQCLEDGVPLLGPRKVLGEDAARAGAARRRHARRAIAVGRAHHLQSMAISGNQWQSVAINDNQW